jgi:hypothetical protein
LPDSSNLAHGDCDAMTLRNYRPGSLLCMVLALQLAAARFVRS